MSVGADEFRSPGPNLVTASGTKRKKKIKNLRPRRDEEGGRWRAQTNV